MELDVLSPQQNRSNIPSHPPPLPLPFDSFNIHHSLLLNTKDNEAREPAKVDFSTGSSIKIAGTKAKTVVSLGALL
jgi:hypothetical protein